MDIRILWWNAQDFAHYDVARKGEAQWPTEALAFEKKLDLVATVLKPTLNSDLIVLGLAETTRVAAEMLRDRLLPGYKVLSLDLLENAELQVAIVYPPEILFVAQQPFVAPYVPEGTRPMAVLDVVYENHRI